MQKEVLGINDRPYIIASSLFYVCSVILLSYLTDATLDLVFVGTWPFLFYLILLHYLANKYFNYVIYWLSPLIFPLIFLLLAANDLWILGKMDAPVVSVLNLIFSYVANALFLVIARNERAAKRSEDKAADILDRFYNLQKTHYLNEIEALKRSLKHAEDKLRITKDNFRVSLTSIEDKCKSINFVIGRVYADKKAGSAKLRHLIRISPELYNSFSEMTKHFDKTLVAKLLKLLEQIYFRLKVIESAERTVFPEESYQRLKIRHDSSGKDRILDVLAENDKDPVKDYHHEALEVCVKIGEYLKSL